MNRIEGLLLHPYPFKSLRSCFRGCNNCKFNNNLGAKANIFDNLDFFTSFKNFIYENKITYEYVVGNLYRDLFTEVGIISKYIEALVKNDILVKYVFFGGNIKNFTNIKQLYKLLVVFRKLPKKIKFGFSMPFRLDISFGNIIKDIYKLELFILKSKDIFKDYDFSIAIDTSIDNSFLSKYTDIELKYIEDKFKFWHNSRIVKVVNIDKCSAIFPKNNNLYKKCFFFNRWYNSNYNKTMPIIDIDIFTDQIRFHSKMCTHNENLSLGNLSSSYDEIVDKMQRRFDILNVADLDDICSYCINNIKI